MDIESLLNDKDTSAHAGKESITRRTSNSLLPAAPKTSSKASTNLATAPESADAKGFVQPGRRLLPARRASVEEQTMTTRTEAIAHPYYVQQGSTKFGAPEAGFQPHDEDDGFPDLDNTASSHSITQGSSGIEKNLPCSSCRKRFSRRSDLVRHERIHSGIRPHECLAPGCGKSFIQRSALTVHERVHSGLKPHICRECSKPFSDSSSLARHRRIHTGHRPYVCNFPGCTKTFTRRTTLTRHQLHHTNEGEELADQADTPDEREPSPEDPPASKPPNRRRKRDVDQGYSEPNQGAEAPETHPNYSYSLQSSTTNMPLHDTSDLQYQNPDGTSLSAVTPAPAYPIRTRSHHEADPMPHYSEVHYAVPRQPQHYGHQESSNYPPLDEQYRGTPHEMYYAQHMPAGVRNGQYNDSAYSEWRL